MENSNRLVIDRRQLFGVQSIHVGTKDQNYETPNAYDDMRTWAPLWSVIVDSSIWTEPDHVLKVFLTMLALKDSDHIYRGNAFNLAQRSHKTESEVLDALKILAAPDLRRMEPQEHEGRRVQAVEEGWLILNGEKYRALVSQEMKRARNRRAQAAYRARKKFGAQYRERAFVDNETNEST